MESEKYVNRKVTIAIVALRARPEGNNLWYSIKRTIKIEREHMKDGIIVKSPYYGDETEKPTEFQFTVNVLIHPQYTL